MDSYKPGGVHLVGSVCLPSAEEVFRRTTSLLPGRLRRIPDGETQHRQQFCAFQRDAFIKAGASQALRKYDAERNPLPPDPVSPEEVERLVQRLGEHHLHPGYDTHAIESYGLFTKLRDEGAIPPGVRFQVSLPTPINVMTMIAPPYQAALEPVYEAALLRDLRRIEAAVPAGDLAVQWDCAIEFAILEGLEYPLFRPWFADEGRDAAALRAHVDAALVRLGSAVGADTELGYHLCYGDIGHRHFCEPRDMGLLADVAREVLRGVGRRVAWLHLPVPKGREDDAYFAQLEDLVPVLVENQTELYLGLVHFDDEEGTRRRIEAASRVLGAFGVGTECGMGRTPPEHFDSIMAISAAPFREFRWSCSNFTSEVQISFPQYHET